MFKSTKLMAVTLALLLPVTLWLIFIYAPEEATQGPVQRIFYFHVAAAFAMDVAFGLGGLFAGLYLWRRNMSHFFWSRSLVSVGLLFCTMVLISGPIWARPIWGWWWTWDPRLTTTLLLWLIFYSTVLLRRFFGTDPRGALFSSILVLFGVIDIPIVMMSVRLWRGIHPVVLGKEGSMPASMRLALVFSMITFFVMLRLLATLNYRLCELEEKSQRRG